MNVLQLGVHKPAKRWVTLRVTVNSVAGAMDVERYWQLFEEMGEDKVVKAIAGKHFLAEKEQAARIWLRRKAEHRASTEQGSLKLVAEANVLAREANATSQKSDKKARTANFVAAAALIVALIALFFKR